MGKINFYTVEYVPETHTSMHQNIPYIYRTQTTFDGMFFVVGRTNNGGRHYSKTVNNYDVAIKMYHDYCDIVSYFGGGTVELYSITEDGCDILSQEIV